MSQPDASTGCLHCRHSGGGQGCVGNVPMFSMLDAHSLNQISQLVRRRDVEAKGTLFSAGDPIQGIYIVRSGSLKLVRYDVQGEERILDILRAGDFYGGNSLFHQSIAPETAIALGKTGICFLPEEGLRDVLMRNPAIGLKIIQYYSAAHERDRSLLEILSIRDVMQRVCHFLLWQGDGGTALSLTQEEIARMIGTAPETLNRKLSELKREGIISMEGHRRIRIAQRHRLEDYARAQ